MELFSFLLSAFDIPVKHQLHFWLLLQLFFGKEEDEEEEGRGCENQTAACQPRSCGAHSYIREMMGYSAGERVGSFSASRTLVLNF